MCALVVRTQPLRLHSIGSLEMGTTTATGTAAGAGAGAGASAGEDTQLTAEGKVSACVGVLDEASTLTELTDAGLLQQGDWVELYREMPT